MFVSWVPPFLRYHFVRKMKKSHYLIKDKTQLIIAETFAIFLRISGRKYSFNSQEILNCITCILFINIPFFYLVLIPHI